VVVHREAINLTLTENLTQIENQTLTENKVLRAGTNHILVKEPTQTENQIPTENKVLRVEMYRGETNRILVKNQTSQAVVAGEIKAEAEEKM